MVVLDTTALLFWCLDPGRLSRPAKQSLSRAPTILVSSISLWEVGVKVGKGKLAIPLSVREFTERLKAVDRVEVLSVDVETWLANLDLPWDHRDPADRTIVATASTRGCPLITSDARIRDFYAGAIW